MYVLLSEGESFFVFSVNIPNNDIKSNTSYGELQIKKSLKVNV